MTMPGKAQSDTKRKTQIQNPDRQWIETLKFDDRGLIPAIAQDSNDGMVLMMAWMNRESIEQTLDTGEAHYWSRSRQELWHKGATSGHIQKIKALAYDCDADTILIQIEQVGNVACHTGARSCFFTTVPTVVCGSSGIEEHC